MTGTAKPDPKYAAARAKIIAASERFKRFRTGKSTDEIMRELRGNDPFPEASDLGPEHDNG